MVFDVCSKGNMSFSINWNEIVFLGEALVWNNPR